MIITASIKSTSTLFDITRTIQHSRLTKLENRDAHYLRFRIECANIYYILPEFSRITEAINNINSFSLSCRIEPEPTRYNPFKDYMKRGPAALFRPRLQEKNDISFHNATDINEITNAIRQFRNEPVEYRLVKNERGIK